MRGFTLVEVLVALVVLEVGLLGVVGTALLALNTLARAELRERMVTESELLLDSLVSVGAFGPGERSVPWGSLSWTPQGETLLLTVRPRRGPSFSVEAPRTVPGGEAADEK